jgi:hypothetical protein
MQTAPCPPEHEKQCLNISCPGRIGTHYVTRRSHMMQIHKFNVMYLGTLFMETTLGPPEHEK